MPNHPSLICNFQPFLSKIIIHPNCFLVVLLEYSLFCFDSKEGRWSCWFESSLEIVHEGTSSTKVPIDKKSFYLIGRQADLCDIVLNDEFLSRKHAVLQHSKEGFLYIYDLSTILQTHFTIDKDPSCFILL